MHQVLLLRDSESWNLSAETARDYHRTLIRQVVRMLCIGLIHGDLSEFNVSLLPTAR